jgi:hypothetical protein
MSSAASWIQFTPLQPSFYIHFNNRSFILGFPGALLLAGSRTGILILFLVSPHACYMPYNPIFLLPNEVCREVQFHFNFNFDVHDINSMMVKIIIIIITSAITILLTESRVRVIGTPASYLGRPGFGSFFPKIGRTDSGKHLSFLNHSREMLW